MYQLDRKTAGGSPAEPFGLLAGSTTGFGSGARQLMNRRGHWTSEPFLDRRFVDRIERSRSAAGHSHGKRSIV